MNIEDLGILIFMIVVVCAAIGGVIFDKWEGKKATSYQEKKSKK